LDDAELKKTWEDYIRTKDQELKNTLIIYYLPLVKSTANRIAYGLPSHVNKNDLISSGIFGLISSIEKYNLDSGTKFKSFASMRIHGSMLDELRNMDWVPRSVRARAKKLQTAYNAIQQEKGRFATDAEIADFLGISLDELNDFVSSTRIINVVSLDAKIFNPDSNSTATYSDFIEDKSKKLPIDNMFKQEKKTLLIKAIEDLSQQEKIVLTLYYFEELTLKEIGEVISVSESRVSQIHSKALFRLRARLSLSEVKDYASN